MSLFNRVETDRKEYPCPHCKNGLRVYRSTATWRGGMGGSAATQDVCDKCWGSGTTEYAWPSHREVEKEGGGE